MSLFDPEPEGDGLFGHASTGAKGKADPKRTVSASSLFDEPADTLFEAPPVAAPRQGQAGGDGASSLFDIGIDDVSSGPAAPTGPPGKDGIVASLFAMDDDSDSDDDSLGLSTAVVAVDAPAATLAPDTAGSGGGSDDDDAETGSAGSSGSGSTVSSIPENRYRVEAADGVVVRQECRMDSAYVRTAPRGEILVALAKEVNEKGVLRVQLHDGWASTTTVDGKTKLMHWMGAADEPESEPEPEPEVDMMAKVSSSLWGFFAPTHVAIAEAEKRALAVAAHTWSCGWCGLEEDLEEEDGELEKMAGPEGPATLCTVCGGRYEEEWECAWCKCKRADTKEIMPGPEDAPQGLCTRCGKRHAAELKAEARRAAEARKEAEAAAAAERAARAEAAEAAAQQRTEQAREQAAQSEVAEAEREKLDQGQLRQQRYRVVNQAVVRVGFHPSSSVAARGALYIGEIIEAVEERVNESGVRRLHFEGGWVSERAGDGTVLLEAGTEWWRVLEPAPIRTGWELESAPPPSVCAQSLEAGQVIMAREIMQDPPDEDGGGSPSGPHSWWQVDDGGAIAFRRSRDLKDEADRAAFPPAAKLSTWRAVDDTQDGWIQVESGMWLPTQYMSKTTDGSDSDDVEEALHIRFGLNRWVSEIDSDGTFLLEKVSELEQEKLALAQRQRWAEEDREAARAREEQRAREEATLRASAAAAAAAQKEAERKRLEEAQRQRQAEADATEVGQWLHGQGLGRYSIPFHDEGYDELLVLKHVTEERVDGLMLQVNMRIGHSFHFREALSALQAEEAEMARARLDDERAQQIVEGTRQEAADLAAAEARAQVAEEAAAAHVSARRTAVQRGGEAQARADAAEIRGYRAGVAMHAAQKQLATDMAKWEALQARQQQEEAMQARADESIAVANHRLKHATLERRGAEMALRVAEQQLDDLQKRQADAISQRKASDAARLEEDARSEELRPRVEHAEEVHRNSTAVLQTSMAAEAAAREALAVEEAHARAGAVGSLARLLRLEAEGAGTGGGGGAVVVAELSTEAEAAERRQIAALEEVGARMLKQLLRVAVSGDQARLVQLLADGVDVNEPSLQGDTALALAMEHGHTELAQMLLDNGADFEQMPTSMWSCAQVVDWFDRAFKWSDRYRVAMETAQIDGEALLAMDEAVLRDDIGVYLASHRRVILRKVAQRREADGVAMARRLLVAESERAALEEQEAERAQRLQQEQAAAIQAERQHELQKLELTWKQTVALSEERSEAAAREAASQQQAGAALPHVQGDHVRLTIKMPNGDHHRVDGWSGEPVSELKERVRRLTGIAPTQQSLSFRFQELNPSLSLGSYKVPDNTILTLSRVRGGRPAGRNNLLLSAFQ